MASALTGLGCFAAPESCSDCNAGEGSGGTGAGGARGGGGALGSGGTLGTGGSTPSTGGSSGSGNGSGGKGTGGTMSTGGSGMGGSGVGGTGMGGSGMGGAGTGGSGTGGAGTGGAGMGGAGGVIDAALVAWYQLDDGNGTTAVDSSGHGRNATVSGLGGGTAAFSTSHEVGTGALNFTSSGAQGVGGLLTLPASLQTMGANTALTIACWVNVRTERDWERIFDFGNGQSSGYMFLTTATQGGTAANTPRFAITLTGNAGEQVINMTTPAVLSTGVWHHMAVVLGTGTTYTGTLYIDKAVAGTNTAMTLRPSSLGNTPNNWIGRSQFAVDPMFDGLIDDFRIYSRALSAAEIAALP